MGYNRDQTLYLRRALTMAVALWRILAGYVELGPDGLVDG